MDKPLVTIPRTPTQTTKASEFKLSHTSKVTVEFAQWNGKWKMSIREWYLDADDEWRPSRNGCSLPMAAATLLMTAVNEQLNRLDEKVNK